MYTSPACRPDSCGVSVLAAIAPVRSEYGPQMAKSTSSSPDKLVVMSPPVSISMRPVQAAVIIAILRWPRVHPRGEPEAVRGADGHHPGAHIVAKRQRPPRRRRRRLRRRRARLQRFSFGENSKSFSSALPSSQVVKTSIASAHQHSKEAMAELQSMADIIRNIRQVLSSKG